MCNYNPNGTRASINNVVRMGGQRNALIIEQQQVISLLLHHLHWFNQRAYPSDWRLQWRLHSHYDYCICIGSYSFLRLKPSEREFNDNLTVLLRTFFGCKPNVFTFSGVNRSTVWFSKWVAAFPGELVPCFLLPRNRLNSSSKGSCIVFSLLVVLDLIRLIIDVTEWFAFVSTIEELDGGFCNGIEMTELAGEMTLDRFLCTGDLIWLPWTLIFEGFRVGVDVMYAWVTLLVCFTTELGFPDNLALP